MAEQFGEAMVALVLAKQEKRRPSASPRDSAAKKARVPPSPAGGISGRFWFDDVVNQEVASGFQAFLLARGVSSQASHLSWVRSVLRARRPASAQKEPPAPMDVEAMAQLLASATGEAGINAGLVKARTVSKRKGWPATYWPPRSVSLRQPHSFLISTHPPTHQITGRANIGVPPFPRLPQDLAVADRNPALLWLDGQRQQQSPRDHDETLNEREGRLRKDLSNSRGWMNGHNQRAQDPRIDNENQWNAHPAVPWCSCGWNGVVVFCFFDGGEGGDGKLQPATSISLWPLVLVRVPWWFWGWGEKPATVVHPHRGCGDSPAPSWICLLLFFFSFP